MVGGSMKRGLTGDAWSSRPVTSVWTDAFVVPSMRIWFALRISPSRAVYEFLGDHYVLPSLCSGHVLRDRPGRR